MILNIYGVTTKILANGNLEQKLDIFINKFNIGFNQKTKRFESECEIIEIIIIENPTSTIIANIGEANMFETKNVSETVLKLFIIIGIIIIFAHIETKAICFI